MGLTRHRRHRPGLTGILQHGLMHGGDPRVAHGGLRTRRALQQQQNLPHIERDLQRGQRTFALIALDAAATQRLEQGQVGHLERTRRALIRRQTTGLPLRGEEIEVQAEDTQSIGRIVRGPTAAARLDQPAVAWSEGIGGPIDRELTLPVEHTPEIVIGHGGHIPLPLRLTAIDSRGGVQFKLGITIYQMRHNYKTMTRYPITYHPFPLYTVSSNTKQERLACSGPGNSIWN